MGSARSSGNHRALAALIRIDDPIRISAREFARDGPPRPPVVTPGQLVGVRRLVILVHGFNNSEAKADNTWATMRRKLEEEGLRPLPSTQKIAQYYWPGDRGLSPSNFADAVSVAKVSCGPELGRFVVRHASLEHVSFIGHSLGCRIALEALLIIHAVPHPTATAALLMAAAVSEAMCEPGARFARPIGGRPVAREESVLYSHRDQVLRWSFWFGQRTVEKRHIDTYRGVRLAVGVNGGPKDRWYPRTRLYGGHGKYWSDDEQSLTAIADTVGIGRLHHVRRSPLPLRLAAAAATPMRGLAEGVIRAVRPR